MKGIFFILVLTCLVQNVMLYKICMMASRRLHDNMVEKILRVPSIFFNTNPSGIILNRFSKDMGLMDDLLPTTLSDVLWVTIISIFFKSVLSFRTILILGIYKCPLYIHHCHDHPTLDCNSYFHCREPIHNVQKVLPKNISISQKTGRSYKISHIQSPWFFIGWTCNAKSFQC